MVRVFTALSPNCAEVAVQKGAEQTDAVGEGFFFFSVLVQYWLWLKVIKIQAGNKDLISAFYANK